MSQIQATASSSSAKHAKVRSTWRTFEQGWFADKKRTLETQIAKADNDYKSLSAAEKAKTSMKQFKANKRAELEKAFYTKAREEWQDRLRKAGLKDEDWGDMKESERKSVEKALGAHPVESEDRGYESSMSATSAAQETTSSSMALVTSSGVPAPPRLFAPSVSTSSVSSYASMASYEFVKPSDLGSDDDGDEDPSELFGAATAAISSTHNSEEDDELGILSNTWRTFEGLPPTTTSTSAYAQQTAHYPQQYTRPSVSTYNTWSSSADSSRHPSANGSPTTTSSGLRNFPNLTSPGTFQTILSSNTTQPEAYSHSRLFDPSYTSASSVAAGSASASSSANARRPKLLHAATSGSTASTANINTNVWTPPGVTSPTTTVPPPIAASSSASASASAAAAAASAVVKSKSSPSYSVSSTTSNSTRHTSVSTSTSTSSYIGPILLEPSDSEDSGLDLEIYTKVNGKSQSKTKANFDPSKLLSPEEAEQEAVDFERFKFETRISKIIEFHHIAAEREVRLGLEIMKMRLKASSAASSADSTANKESEASTALVKFSGTKNDKNVREEEKKRIAEHEEGMRRLQQEKEVERKQLVREERKRRRAALQLRVESGEKPVAPGDHEGETLSNPTWLDPYDTVQAVFEVAVPNGDMEAVFGKRARSSTITQSSPQPGSHPPSQAPPPQRGQSRVNGRQSTKPYPRAHSTKPYRPPPSPDVPIARPRPLPAAWGQIPFIQDEEEEEDGYEEGEEEGDEYEVEYEWQYEGDPSQAGYPPGPPGQQPFHPEQQQHGQQPYHPQQQQARHAQRAQHQHRPHGQETFMPRMFDDEEHHRLQHQHHQGQQSNQFGSAYGDYPPHFANYDPSVRLEIERALEELNSKSASYGGSSFGNGSSDMGYMSDTLGAYGQGGRGAGSGGGSPEHGYMSDSMALGYNHGHQGHQASAHSHNMQHNHNLNHAHSGHHSGGGSMPIQMTNSSSSSSSMNIPMPGGIGSSPMEVSTPRVGSTHPWGSTANGGGFGNLNSMLSKTPTKTSPLATRGDNPFANGSTQAAGQTQQQQATQPTMLGGWGRKNSIANASIDEPPVQSPNPNTAPVPPTSHTSANGTSSLTSGLSWAAKKFSLFGGSGSTPAPAEPPAESKLPLAEAEDQDDDDEEEEGEEEEEEEEAAPPPPPAKKKGKNAPPPPPPPAPVQTTAKGKKGKGKNAPAPPPPGEKEKPVEKAAAAPPPPPAKETKEPAGKKSKKGRQATKKATKAEPEQPSLPVPPPPTKQTSSSKQAQTKPRDDEEEEEEEGAESMNIPGGLSSSTGSLWDSDVSSTPKPPAKTVNSSQWGPANGAAVIGGNDLRKQMYQQHMVTQKQADEKEVVKPTGGNVVDEIPASVHEALWAKARAANATPVATVNGGRVGAATPVGRTGWKASANGPSRLGNKSVFDSFDDDKNVKTSTPAAGAGRTKATSPTIGGARKKGGPSKTVTMEEIPDEEENVLNHTLPLNHRGIMEPKSPDPMSRMPNIQSDFVALNAAAIAAAQSTSSPSSSSAMNNAKGGGTQMRQPKPSVPGMFNDLFDYGNGNAQQPGSQQRNWNDEDGFFSSNPASMLTTPSSTAPTSPEDGLMQGMGEAFLKKAQAQLSGKASSSSASAARTSGAKKGMDGFSTDWEGTLKAKKGGGGWGNKSMLSGVMSEDEMPRANLPGSFSRPPGNSMGSMMGGANKGMSASGAAPTMSIWEAGKQKQAQAQAAAKANAGQKSGGAGSGNGSEADDLFARFAKSQELENMKRTGGSR